MAHRRRALASARANFRNIASVLDGVSMSSIMGLPSFSEAHRRSTSLSLLAVLPDPVSEAGDLAKGWLHLTVEPSLSPQQCPNGAGNKVVDQVTNVGVESREDVQVVTSPWSN